MQPPFLRFLENYSIECRLLSDSSLNLFAEKVLKVELFAPSYYTALGFGHQLSEMHGLGWDWRSFLMLPLQIFVSET